MNPPNQAFLIGGGIASLAAAAFLIRDGGWSGERITVLEAGPVLGGSLDGAGDPEQGYVMRGGRMLTSDNYECTWDLFGSIPSITQAGQSVHQETLQFNQKHHSHALARLVNRHRARMPVTSMGFSMQDRLELLRLHQADEDTLGNTCITDHLSPSFFETPFWFMWCTTFAFQPWHSAVEFRRYLHRFMLEFARIETLAGVKRTVYNQYDSLVRPLQQWLLAQGVHVVPRCTVTRLEHQDSDSGWRVTALHSLREGQPHHQAVAQGDLVFLQNGSMTDASSLGSMAQPAPAQASDPHGAWALWTQLAAQRPGLGRPEVFNRQPALSNWTSFTVTLKTPDFFDTMARFSGNEAGTGGLVTLRDSHWLMSIVLAHQPHFPQQPASVQVCWGYGLFPDRVGNFVNKAMNDCNGAELLQELAGHLRLELSSLAGAICIPCRMPFITSMFLPRAPGDRPLPLPPGSRDFALLGQFVELPLDTVFTVEYSVRSAQTAVYQLLQLERDVPPVTPHDHHLHAQFEALLKALR